MNQYFELIKKEKRLVTFIFLSALLYGIWFVLYEFWLKNEGHLDQIITMNLTYFMCKLLNFTGHDVTYSQAMRLGEAFVFKTSEPLPFLRVGASCNGMELFVLFTIFILCFPGKWKTKIIFIVAGNIFIHFLNILRNYWLALFSLHKSTWFDFFHRYVFIFMVYGAIFLMWMWWVNKFSDLKQKKEK